MSSSAAPAFEAPLPVERLDCLTLTHGSHEGRADGVVIECGKELVAK